MFLWLKYHKKLNKIKRWQANPNCFGRFTNYATFITSYKYEIIKNNSVTRVEETRGNPDESCHQRQLLSKMWICLLVLLLFATHLIQIFSSTRVTKLISTILCSYASSYASRGFASQEVFAMYLHYQWWVVVK